jgi:CHASE3 domain sensor protein
MLIAVETMYLKAVETLAQDTEKVFELLEKLTSDAYVIDDVQDQLFGSIEKYFEEFEALVVLGRCARLDELYRQRRSDTKRTEDAIQVTTATQRNSNMQRNKSTEGYARFLALPFSLAVRLLNVSLLRKIFLLTGLLTHFIVHYVFVLCN